MGINARPGTASYDAATQTYMLSSAGANTWYHVDDFHFLWKKSSGDLSLAANVTFDAPTYSQEPNPHRKGTLMFRQSLDAGSAYVAVGVHGNGLTALQYRRERGANTQDIELNIAAPQTVRIDKHGDEFTLYLSMKGEPLHPVGASISLPLKAPFYVGLGALSHDAAVTDKIEFKQVSLAPAPSLVASKPVLYSTLQTVQVEDQFRRAIVIRSVPALMKSPNWAPGGKSIVLQEDGRLLEIPYLTPEAGGTPRPIDTGGLVDCSDNLGWSPNGQWLAVSCSQSHGGPHQVYVLSSGSTSAPRKVTSGADQSFFHGWAPDNDTLAFTRGSAGKADIFTISVSGGPERQLTRDRRNDGPDFSPDGRYLYFDSTRSGTSQLWRMHVDGSAAEQLTDDDRVNSSPHVSIDGKSIAFLSQPRGASDAVGPASIKVMSFGDGLIRTVVELRGNRGSFSMYGWGDASHLAFVSYDEAPSQL